MGLIWQNMDPRPFTKLQKLKDYAKGSVVRSQCKQRNLRKITISLEEITALDLLDDLSDY